MIHKIKIVSSLVVLAAGMAFAESQSGSEYSHVELQTMIRSAHSAPQYQALASYFRTRQQVLAKQAMVEKAEWERRGEMTAAVAQKYPRPVDSSRNRYEYFKYEANRMGQQAAHYESLSANSQTRNAQ